ncbi:MAG: IS1634 family transposase [Paracoccaceae bacterium]
MYIENVPNRKSRPAILLRQGWREGKSVRKRTLANLTDWPADKIEALRRVLRGERLVAPEAAFVIERSLPHGHVEALLAMIRRLGLDRLIAAKRSPERDLVLAMIIERLIHPASKLATTRLWHTSTLAQELELEEGDADDLYAAMDWLLERQGRIEHRLARRHLDDGAPVFYDVTSSYYEGRTCPLMRFGHNRDGKRGKTQVVYGVLTAPGGRPVAVEVYAGNTGDPATVPDQVTKLRERFGLNRVVLVGDRGMLTETQIGHLKRHPGLGWISALKASAIRALVDQASLQLSLFDERDLAEITSDAFPGERLVACYNPLLADERARKREDLLTATETALDKIARQVARRTKTPLSAAQIGQKVGRVIARFKVAKHFELDIDDGRFAYRRNQETIQAEARLDGLYVIRTSEPEARLSAPDTVRAYKGLAQLERLIRSLKGLQLLIRPIRHREERRVRAHIFLCLLAGYLEWHLRRAWAPLLFDDESLEHDRKTRDPVAPAAPTPEAKRKKARRRTEDGLPLHSFETLMAELATRCRNTCRITSDPSAPAFQQLTQPTETQRRARALIDTFPVPGSA